MRSLSHRERVDVAALPAEQPRHLRQGAGLVATIIDSVCFLISTLPRSLSDVASEPFYSSTVRSPMSRRQ